MSSPPPFLGPSVLRHLWMSLPASDQCRSSYTLFYYLQIWSTISGLWSINLNTSGSPLEFNKEKYGL
ncbi:hypothetical protein EV363DRAFT_1174710 [Boletus edulis]|nr:hypothetical protein EV363DRAFT_1174710 [Boletus edulis]